MTGLSNAPSQDMALEDMLEFLIPRGFPTFDEFKKNPDKYRINPEHLFESADGSVTTGMRKRLFRQKYYWRDQYDCGDSLEKVQRIAKDEGYEITDLEMQPRVATMDGTSKQGRVEITVHFWPKAEFKAMGGIVANEQS